MDNILSDCAWGKRTKCKTVLNVWNLVGHSFLPFSSSNEKAPKPSYNVRSFSSLNTGSRGHASLSRRSLKTLRGRKSQLVTCSTQNNHAESSSRGWFSATLRLGQSTNILLFSTTCHETWFTSSQLFPHSPIVVAVFLSSSGLHKSYEWDGILLSILGLCRSYGQGTLTLVSALFVAKTLNFQTKF